MWSGSVVRVASPANQAFYDFPWEAECVYSGCESQLNAMGPKSSSSRELKWTVDVVNGLAPVSQPPAAIPRCWVKRSIPLRSASALVASIWKSSVEEAPR